MLIRRRQLLLSLSAASILGSGGRTSANEDCPYAGLPAGTCSAYIDPTKFESQSVASTQEQSQWCWAACISMICKWHGYDLPQKSIVEQMYGSAVNMPADDRVLTQAINRDWQTASGQKISIRAQIFSPALNKSDVLNSLVVDDLKGGYPLINGSGSHATVTARVDYRPVPGGQPQVFRVHVIDPWPTATNNTQRARFLDGQEMVPAPLGGSLRYLASVRVAAA